MPEITPLQLLCFKNLHLLIQKFTSINALALRKIEGSFNGASHAVCSIRLIQTPNEYFGLFQFLSAKINFNIKQ